MQQTAIEWLGILLPVVGFLYGVISWFIAPLWEWYRDSRCPLSEFISRIYVDPSLVESYAAEDISKVPQCEMLLASILSVVTRLGSDKVAEIVKRPKDIKLSVVVPAYNEEHRLPLMMREAIAYLKKRRQEDSTFSFELVVVSDGSVDKTCDVACQIAEELDVIMETVVVRMRRNKGKGFAVKIGMILARGERKLMVDADGATKFQDLEKLEALLSKDIKVVFGSRNHLQDEAIAKRTMLRNSLMTGFHFLVGIVIGSGIKDTQCGFKLFTREASDEIFPAVHMNNWAFDIEICVLAKILKLSVAEVSVNWQEIGGSKLNVASATFQMARDMVWIRLLYFIRFWTTRDRPALWRIGGTSSVSSTYSVSAKKTKGH